MTPDPFPNELVEAAAVLLDGMTCERCDGEGYIEIHDPNAAHADNPDGSHDEYCPDCCASGRAGFRKAAALIEQRVIDRLAREAGGEPRTGRGGHARTGPRSSGPRCARHLLCASLLERVRNTMWRLPGRCREREAKR